MTSEVDTLRRTFSSGSEEVGDARFAQGDPVVSDLDSYPIRIVSDGTSFGTQVLVFGKPIDTVSKASWTVTVGDFGRATIEFFDVPVDLKAPEADLRPVQESAEAA